MTWDETKSRCLCWPHHPSTHPIFFNNVIQKPQKFQLPIFVCFSNGHLHCFATLSTIGYVICIHVSRIQWWTNNAFWIKSHVYLYILEDIIRLHILNMLPSNNRMKIDWYIFIEARLLGPCGGAYSLNNHYMEHQKTLLTRMFIIFSFKNIF